MTLTDAGPLIAIIDADEPDHEACVSALDGLELPLVTTWPAFTEAMYLLAKFGGIEGQRALWRLVHTDRLIIANLSAKAVDRSTGRYDGRGMTQRSAPSHNTLLSNRAPS